MWLQSLSFTNPWLVVAAMDGSLPLWISPSMISHLKPNGSRVTQQSLLSQVYPLLCQCCHLGGDSGLSIIFSPGCHSRLSQPTTISLLSVSTAFSSLVFFPSTSPLRMNFLLLHLLDPLQGLHTCNLPSRYPAWNWFDTPLEPWC